MIISLRLLSKSVYYCTYSDSLKVILIADAKGSLLPCAVPKFETGTYRAARKRAYHLVTPHPLAQSLRQCCGSGAGIRDPGLGDF
jgi:hypothetical protein